MLTACIIYHYRIIDDSACRVTKVLNGGRGGGGGGRKSLTETAVFMWVYTFLEDRPGKYIFRAKPSMKERVAAETRRAYDHMHHIAQLNARCPQVGNRYKTQLSPPHAALELAMLILRRYFF